MTRLALYLSILAIVLLMGAVLFPVCACGHYAAKRTACISNLKQQGLGVQMYLADWDNRLPNRDRWMDQTKGYVKRDGVFHDPEVQGKESFGYGYDADLSGKNAGSWAKADKEPMIYDSTNLGRNASDRMASLPVPGRHSGRNGMAYLDGHARSLPKP